MESLAFLAEPAFVIAWYVVGALGAAWVVYDLHTANTPLKQAMKWAWPIIVFFFSVIGLALYFTTARAPGIGKVAGEQAKQERHNAYEPSMVRRVNGAVIHCVAGDGLGIMTAMVIARLLGLTFWQEFWFEYAVGFAFGLFIFQYKSMKMMTDNRGRALWMAFRAEFFSMLTVMGGMGAVMTNVTPMVVGAQPPPTTAAFWGFGAFGLLVGYLCTFPVNWVLVKVGWKHGMGSKEAVKPVKTQPLRAGLFTAMWALGVLALAAPAWLTVLRETKPLDLKQGEGPGAPPAEGVASARSLERGLEAARSHLRAGERSAGVEALDAAMRSAMVLKAQDEQDVQPLLHGIREVRHALENGRRAEALRRLADLHPPAIELASLAGRVPPGAGDYRDVKLLDAHGAPIGEVRRVSQERVQIGVGGWHDVFGFWDSPRETRSVPLAQVVFGPQRTIGKSYAMLLPAQDGAR